MIGAYLVPYFLLISVLFLYKKCLIFINDGYGRDEKEIVVPRILVVGSLIISAIPFVGYLMTIIIAMAFPLNADKTKVRQNRFTNYWFK